MVGETAERSTGADRGSAAGLPGRFQCSRDRETRQAERGASLRKFLGARLSIRAVQPEYAPS